MPKCPKCRSEMVVVGDILQCVVCGSKFKIPDSMKPLLTAANAESSPEVQDDYDVDESPEMQDDDNAPSQAQNNVSIPLPTRAMTDAEKIVALEKRLAVLEEDKYKRDHRFDWLKNIANSAAVKFIDAHLGAILLCTMLLVAFITLMTTLVGLRGIYVNVNDSFDYIDFTATSYRTSAVDPFTGKEQLEKGTWKRKGDKLILTVDDELFGKIDDELEFKKLDGFKRVRIGNAEYKRVSLVGIQTTKQKVTVTFDPRNGKAPIVYKMKIGSIFDEDLPEVTKQKIEFLGWVTKDGYYGKDTVVGQKIWEDITLYASWQNYEIKNDVLTEVYDVLFGHFDCPRVSAIGAYAFADCEELESISIPDSVKSIGDYAFARCTGLKTISIPDSVTSIGEYAFRSCTNLQTIIIGKGIKSIGKYAFSSCTSLKDIHYKSSKYQWNTISKGASWGPPTDYQMHYYSTGMSEASAAIEDGSDAAAETIYVDKIAAPTLWVKRQRLAA